MDLLINLDSPNIRNKVNANYATRSPLLPCSTVAVGVDNQNNPFDAVINAIELNQQPNDPFDLVLQAAVNHSSKDDGSKPGIANRNMLNNQVDAESEVIDVNKIKKNVKEYVAERINTCIRRSIGSSSSPKDLDKNIKSTGKYFRRSFSAGVISPFSCSTIVEESSSKQFYNTLNTSLPSATNETSKNVKAENYCDSLEMTKRKLREEANKIASFLSNESLQNFSDVKESTCDTDSNSENLFDLRPPWESEVAISDEEDSIGLPKLRTYYRHSFSGVANIDRVAIEEKALKKYMKTKKISLEKTNEDKKEKDVTPISETFTPDQIVASSSILEDSTETIPTTDNKNNEDLKESKQIETILVNNIITNQPLRPKKKTVCDNTKKGPMRAVMPLQKMSKNISAKLLSPFKKQGSSNKDNNNTEKDLKPIAASTPTKSVSPISNVSSARMRSQENNKMSPTGRKSVTRSRSVDPVGNKTSKNTKQPATPTKDLQTSSNSEVKKNVNVDRNLPKRPQSAPSKSSFMKQDNIISNFRRSALKALTSKQINGTSQLSDPEKVVTKNKQPTTKLTSHDKENQMNKKK